GVGDRAGHLQRCEHIGRDAGPAIERHSARRDNDRQPDPVWLALRSARRRHHGQPEISARLLPRLAIETWLHKRYPSGYLFFTFFLRLARLAHGMNVALT